MAPGLGGREGGGLAFFVVCGLLGALGLVGLHVFSIVEELDSFREAGHAEIVAVGLRSMLLGGGSVLGLASAVYLLAPAAEHVDEPALDPSA